MLKKRTKRISYLEGKANQQLMKFDENKEDKDE